MLLCFLGYTMHECRADVSLQGLTRPQGSGCVHLLCDGAVTGWRLLQKPQSARRDRGSLRARPCWLVRWGSGIGRALSDHEALDRRAKEPDYQIVPTLFSGQSGPRPGCHLHASCIGLIPKSPPPKATIGKLIAGGLLLRRTGQARLWQFHLLNSCHCGLAATAPRPGSGFTSSGHILKTVEVIDVLGDRRRANSPSCSATPKRLQIIACAGRGGGDGSAPPRLVG